MRKNETRQNKGTKGDKGMHDFPLCSNWLFVGGTSAFLFYAKYDIMLEQDFQIFQL